jgi:hypothetical protein
MNHVIPSPPASETILFIHSFIRQWLYSALLGPGLFFSFVIFFTQTVGLLGRVISPSQGLDLNTGQHKHRISAHTDIHSLSAIRIHDQTVRASEDTSCLRPRGHCNRPETIILTYLLTYLLMELSPS